MEVVNIGFVFLFVEGVFVKVIWEGYWFLLDEVNLVLVEILERLMGVLEGIFGILLFIECGDVENVFCYFNFCIFGCMNLVIDFGKCDLLIVF